MSSEYHVQLRVWCRFVVFGKLITLVIEKIRQTLVTKFCSHPLYLLALLVLDTFVVSVQNDPRIWICGADFQFQSINDLLPPAQGHNAMPLQIHLNKHSASKGVRSVVAKPLDTIIDTCSPTGRVYPPTNHLQPAYNKFGRANGMLLLSTVRSALDAGGTRTKTPAAEQFQH